MRSKQQGFTLVELMVTVAIFAIMSLIAYPNMTEWVAQRRVANKAEQMANLLRLSRAEAVRIGSSVYICPVDITDAGKQNNYCSTKDPEGYAAFADANKNNEFDNEDIPLRVVPLNTASRKTMAFSLNRFDNDQEGKQVGAAYMPNGSFGYIEYTSQGKISPLSKGIVRIKLYDIKPENKQRDRAQVFVVESSGRMHFCKSPEIRDNTNKKCYFS